MASLYAIIMRGSQRRSVKPWKSGSWILPMEYWWPLQPTVWEWTSPGYEPSSITGCHRQQRSIFRNRDAPAETDKPPMPMWLLRTMMRYQRRGTAPSWTSSFQTAAGGVHSLRKWDRRKMSARVVTYAWVRLPCAILLTDR